MAPARHTEFLGSPHEMKPRSGSQAGSGSNILDIGYTFLGPSNGSSSTDASSTDQDSSQSSTTSGIAAVATTAFLVLFFSIVMCTLLFHAARAGYLNRRRLRGGSGSSMTSLDAESNSDQGEYSASQTAASSSANEITSIMLRLHHDSFASIPFDAELNKNNRWPYFPLRRFETTPTNHAQQPFAVLDQPSRASKLAPQTPFPDSAASFSHPSSEPSSNLNASYPPSAFPSPTLAHPLPSSLDPNTTLPSPHNECCICIEDFKQGDILRRLAGCGQ